MTADADSPSHRLEADVAIVGGGLAGLKAAADLTAAGLSVVLLEAKTELGGRTRAVTFALPSGATLRTSGAAVSLQALAVNPLVDLARRIAAPTVPETDWWARIVDREGRAHDSAPYLEAWEAAHDRAVDASLEREVPEADASVARFYEADADVTDGDLYRGLVRQTTEHYGAPWSDVSLRWFGVDEAGEGGALYMTDSFAPIVEDLHARAADTGRLTLRLGEAVERVVDTDDGIVLHTAGGAVHARAAVVTVPLGVLQHRDIAFGPPLPPRRLASIDRLGMGRLEKFVLVYADIWWEASVDGTLLVFDPAPALAGVSTLSVWDRSRVLPGVPAVLEMFLAPEAATALESAPDDAEVVRWAHAILAVKLPRRHEPTPPVHHLVTRWASDPYCRGAYSFTPVGGASPLDRLELARPLWDGRLGFAGEATHLEHWSYTHGAYLTGEREAARVLRLLRTKQRDCNEADT